MKARIFVSSTYYDLRYLREQIINFIENDYGFEAIAFEDGDVTYTPEQSMIKSCKNEVQYCHAMILIIGNTYGTKTEDNLSFTREEYKEADKFTKPIFAFVESHVYTEYQIYIRKNKRYTPAIADSKLVFEFIDEIVKKGICIKDFNCGTEICDFLKNQWAGLFSNYFGNTLSFVIQPTPDIKKESINSAEYDRFKTELEKRVKNNDAPATLLLGYYYLMGNIYYKRDFNEAFKLIKKAADEQAYLPAKNILGAIYYRGIGVKQNYKMSFICQLEAAKDGDAIAMESVAFHYRNGIGCEQDIDKALEWYKKCTDIVENALWQNAMGETYEWKNDIKNAKAAYERASEKLARACFNLAKLYHRKLIGESDYMQYAIDYYKMADEKGMTEASAVLGRIYFQGSMDNVEEQDFKTAESYLSKAANDGNAESQYILGYIYEYGLNGNINHDLAIDYYRKAALQDHAQAQYSLGQLLLDYVLYSEPVKKIESGEAFKWIHRAYEQGHLEAKRTTADMYKYGVGCDKSNIMRKKIIESITTDQFDEITNTINSIYSSI